MNTLLKKGINVATSSTEGHFVHGTKNVIALDEVNETFLVKGSATLTSKNHTSLSMKDDCVITCQQVYNPFEKAFEKSRD